MKAGVRVYAWAQLHVGDDFSIGAGCDIQRRLREMAFAAGDEGRGELGVLATEARRHGEMKAEIRKQKSEGECSAFWCLVSDFLHSSGSLWGMRN